MRVPPNERGAALLTVLLLVAVIGAIASSALGKLRLQTAVAINSASAGQARAFGSGLESLIALTIDDFTARSPNRTTLAGNWNGAARRYPLPGGGLAEAVIRDGGNCFNVNSVAQGSVIGGLVARPAGIAQFVGLMRLLEVPQGQAVRIASAAADWVDSDGETMREGAEDSAYASGAAPYRAGNTLFAEVSELRAVAGMTPEVYERVRPWLCALPEAVLSPINVNTLSPEQAPLLAMLAPEEISLDAARRILAGRPEAGWGGTDAFWLHPALEGLVPPGDVLLQPQVKTVWFTADMTIALKDAEILESALIDARYRPARVVVRRWGVDE